MKLPPTMRVFATREFRASPAATGRRPGRRAEIVRRYRAGQLVREIALAMGCSHQIVERELRGGMPDPERRRIANRNKARAARNERFTLDGAERVKAELRASRGPIVTDCVACFWRVPPGEPVPDQCPKCGGLSFEAYLLDLAGAADGQTHRIRQREATGFEPFGVDDEAGERFLPALTDEQLVEELLADG